ncbi:MAG: hypothetical protein ABI376_04775, partial [Caulobacteraceae bacterium]
CETATPFQPANTPGARSSGGYSDQQLETNRWAVEFSGNSLTSRDTVEKYLLFRAAELTLAQGYSWFASVDHHTSRQTSFYTNPDPFFSGWGPYWGGYYRGGGRFGGWYGAGWGDPYFAGSFNTQQVDRYQAAAEIVMGHGAKPADNPHAYDAQDVVSHLRGSIQYPRAS